MKCTDCYREVKPVVAIDIDGTLGDYHDHFLEFAENYLNLSAEWDFAGSEKFRVWFCHTYGVDKRTYEDIKLAYRQGAQKRSMPAFPGASALCRQVRRAGAELWITTTRPYMRLDNIDPDTRAWLERHGITYDHLMYDENKYPRLAELVGSHRVVAVLDDLEEQYGAAQATFGSAAILRRTRWNANVAAAVWVDDLGEATKKIVSNVYQWEDQYAVK